MSYFYINILMMDLGRLCTLITSDIIMDGKRFEAKKMEVNYYNSFIMLNYPAISNAESCRFIIHG